MVQPSGRELNETERKIAKQLAEGAFITEGQLEEATLEVRSTGSPLRAVLVAKGFVADEIYSASLSTHMRVPRVDLRQVTVDPEAVRLVPEELARRYRALPLGAEGNILRVAMDDPQDIEAINNLSTVTGLTVKPRLPFQGSVVDLLDRYYRAAPQVARQLETILGVEPPSQPQPETAPTPRPTVAAGMEVPQPIAAESLLAAEEVARAPVVQALNMIINQGVRDRASDIHIEPTETSVKIRYRIDGVLQQAADLPKGVHSALVSRVKVISGMDIAERRRPQDGHFSLKVGPEGIDFRVASMETSYGEKVVMRILSKTAAVFSLPDLGFLPESLQAYQQLLSVPYGMIMVNGPTGSGKTTTLYASLQTLDARTQNIMTIEDPIEYRFDGVSQTQVNEQAGITFAAGLRAMMRMDPDVILVGEIRDRETASVAVQAALTGHLVLTTIHANDAASAIVRLIDLGVEPFLVTSAVVGSVAQRLVRKICLYCKQLGPPVPATEVAAYSAEMGETRNEFYGGRGCNICNRTGFSGRLGVFEVLTMTDEIRKLIQSNATGEEIRAKGLQAGMTTLRRDGMLKARDGLTTPREIMRHVFTIS